MLIFGDMEIFLTLFSKLIPLYLIIILGFLAAKFLKSQKETIASLLIYIITPVIVFHGAYTTKISPLTLVLPVIFFSVASLICLSVYQFAKRIWHDTTKNILAFATGSGNTGYFGLPVAVAIFGDSILGMVVLCILGMVLYENTVGFFITARGHHTIMESIKKVLGLPAIYAFFLGILVNLSGITLSGTYFDTINIFRGSYTLWV